MICLVDSNDCRFAWLDDGSGWLMIVLIIFSVEVGRCECSDGGSDCDRCETYLGDIELL